MATKCRSCGVTLAPNEVICYCGVTSNDMTQSKSEQDNYFGQFNNGLQNGEEQPRTVFGGLGLGFGIAAIILFWIPFLGLLFGILGIVFAALAKRVKGLRVAAFICSGFGTLFSLIITGLIIIGFAFLGNLSVDSGALLQQELDNMNTILGPVGVQHELVGIWAWEVTDENWFSFRADGTAVNLRDGEEFRWHEDGTISGAEIYERWEINGGILTIHWNFGGLSYNYRRQTNTNFETVGVQHELVGIWIWEMDGTEWYSFRADGTALNLMDGEEFFWFENGSLNALVYTNWEINGDVLTIHRSDIFGVRYFNYRRR